MYEKLLVPIITTALASSGFFTLIQYLIKRHDEKNDKKNGVIAAVSALNNKVDTLCEDFAESRATGARNRIIRFSDEMRRSVRHSEELFNQILGDIKTYNDYCETHPNYENNKATAAIKHIQSVYDECLKNNDFLM